MKIKKNDKNIGIIIDHPNQYRGKFSTNVFGENKKNKKPIFLEIRCGKGEFLFSASMNSGGYNYIGFEERYNEIQFTHKMLEGLLTGGRGVYNIKLIRENVKKMDDIFGVQEISKIRVSYPEIVQMSQSNSELIEVPELKFDSLRKYLGVLTEGGKIEILTLDKKVFDYAKKVIEDSSVFFNHDEVYVSYSENAYEDGKYSPRTTFEVNDNKEKKKLYFIEIDKLKQSKIDLLNPLSI